MAGDHDRAGALAADRLLEFVAEHRGEVVGGFVEQQQVRRAGHQQGEGEAAALADGEGADGAVQVGGGQQAEGGERDAFGPVGAEGLFVGGAGGAFRAVEGGVLGEQTHRQAGAPADLSGGVEATGQHGEQGGLARAVRAGDQEPVVGGDVEFVQGEPAGHPDPVQRHQRAGARLPRLPRCGG